MIVVVTCGYFNKYKFKLPHVASGNHIKQSSAKENIHIVQLIGALEISGFIQAIQASKPEFSG